MFTEDDVQHLKVIRSKMEVVFDQIQDIAERQSSFLSLVKDKIEKDNSPELSQDMRKLLDTFSEVEGCIEAFSMWLKYDDVPNLIKDIECHLYRY